MTELTFDPFRFDLEGLTPRAIAIYEYLIGLLIEQAARQTGRQPRRNVPPLFAALRTMAEQTEQRFEVSARGFGITLDATGPIGSARWELKVPDGWQDSYETSPARLLGQRVMRETTQRRKSAQGKREKSVLWAGRIADAARALQRPKDREETIAKLQDRVFEHLEKAVDSAHFDTSQTMVSRAPSRSVVKTRLRELGYTRGRYPPGR